MNIEPTPAGEKILSGRVVAPAAICMLLLFALVISLLRHSVKNATDERHTLESAAVVIEQPVGDDEPGWWRCELVFKKVNAELQPHDLWNIKEAEKGIGFDLWIPQAHDDRSAHLRNGSRFVPVEHRWDGDDLTLDFPRFGGSINATRTIIDFPITLYQDTQGLVGSWAYRTQAGISYMGFKAWQPDLLRPGPLNCGVRPYDTEQVPERVEIWELDFNHGGVARAVFRYGSTRTLVPRFEYQNGTSATQSSVSTKHKLNVTIERPNGVKRHLVGHIVIGSGDPTRDNAFVLSSFDGGRALKLEGYAPSEDSDRFDGWFMSGINWRERFTATRLPQGKDVEFRDPPGVVSPLD